MRSNLRKLADREWHLKNLYKIRDENRQLINLDINKFPNQRKIFNILKTLGFQRIHIVIPKGHKINISTLFLIL